MAQVELNGKTVECVRGDITRQDDLEAVVNAANAQLMSGAVSQARSMRRQGQGWLKSAGPWHRSARVRR